MTSGYISPPSTKITTRVGELPTHLPVRAQTGRARKVNKQCMYVFSTDVGSNIVRLPTTVVFEKTCAV